MRLSIQIACYIFNGLSKGMPMSGAGNCCVSPQAGRASPCKMSKFGQYDPDAASATSAMPVEGHGHRIIFFPAGEFKYRSATGIELVRMCVHCTSHIYIYISSCCRLLFSLLQDVPIAANCSGSNAHFACSQPRPLALHERFKRSLRM